MSDVQRKLNQWASRCDFALGDYLDVCKPLYQEAPRLGEREQFVLNHLAANCLWTSESALLLVSKARLWDAEMLIRSVLEGTYKFAFLCIGDDKTRIAKIEEYWDIMPEMALIKHHKRAQQLLEKVDNPQASIWRPIRELLLTPDKLADLESQYPRRVKQQLEQRWSFSEITKALSAPEVYITGFDALTIIMFSYGTAGHLLHQDGNAIKLIYDRNNREPERLHALELAHGARELGDLIFLASLRALITFKSYRADTRPLSEMVATHRELLDELSSAADEWYNVEYGID